MLLRIVSLIGNEEGSLAPDGRSGQTPFFRCLVNHNTLPHPLFFVSVASKGLSHAVSLLFATLAWGSISVAAKGLTGADCGRERSREGWEEFGGVRRTAWRGDRETEEQQARGEEIGVRPGKKWADRRGWM